MDKEKFLKASGVILETLYDEFTSLPILNFTELDKDKTALIIVDMINGFVKEGALSSPQMASLTPEIVKLTKKFKNEKLKIVALADNHPEDSVEFCAYPPHCIKGTSESFVIDELQEVGGYELIEKNSTNGFLEPTFQDWLSSHPEIDTFIITGGCTDICVLQLALTLKMHFNRLNKKTRIIVPTNGVNTYDLGTHFSSLMHLFALYNMRLNDIEIVKEVK
ncbi:MAG: cysteine hydrolase [Bacilli bacterium]|nr:cysteine hydrolase [Bacilli bacterium]